MLSDGRNNTSGAHLRTHSVVDEYKIARDAIEMFLEYRDKYGYAEDIAKDKAILEVTEIDAEIDKLKSDLAKKELEIVERIADTEEHYRAEIEKLKADLAESRERVKAKSQMVSYLLTNQPCDEALTARIRELREALEKALPIMEKVSRYDSYHQEWEVEDYENAPPEEVIMRAIDIARKALEVKG